MISQEKIEKEFQRIEQLRKNLQKKKNNIKNCNFYDLENMSQLISQVVSIIEEKPFYDARLNICSYSPQQILNFCVVVNDEKSEDFCDLPFPHLGKENFEELMKKLAEENSDVFFIVGTKQENEMVCFQKTDTYSFPKKYCYLYDFIDELSMKRLTSNTGKLSEKQMKEFASSWAETYLWNKEAGKRILTYNR